MKFSMPKVVFNDEMEGKLIELWAHYQREKSGTMKKRSQKEKEIAEDLNLYARSVGLDMAFDSMGSRNAPPFHPTFKRQGVTSLPYGIRINHAPVGYASPQVTWPRTAPPGHAPLVERTLTGSNRDPRKGARISHCLKA